MKMPTAVKKLFWTCGVAALSALCGCGYFMSGTWEDDAGNWKRAYGYKVPDSVEIVYSWYWRSPHWTLEQELYFETEFNEEIVKAFTSSGDLARREEVSEIEKLYLSANRPQWYAPKPLSQYEVWTSKKPDDNFHLLIDRETGHLFWHDLQL